MIKRIFHGSVLELRLDRPPVNAFDPALMGSIVSEVRGAPERGARALVLSGREGMFSAGLDVPVLFELNETDLNLALEVFFDSMEVLALSPIPVAAAITGHSPAAGAILALFCDWRVMADGPYSIGLNEVQIGIPMPEVVAALVARTVGYRWAEILCVSGRLLEPTEALNIGLIDQVVPGSEVIGEALRWCEKILEPPARALDQTRRSARRDLGKLIREHRTGDVDRLTKEWFRPGLQASLRALVDRLKGK